MRRLCAYHRDSLGWDACSEDFDGCEVEAARRDDDEAEVNRIVDEFDQYIVEHDDAEAEQMLKDWDRKESQ